eukprot:403354447
MFQNFKYRVINILDMPYVNIMKHFASAISFIRDAISSGGTILVHCYAGISRSASCVIAYLMQDKGMPFFEAMSYVRKRRHIVFPNFGFQRQLMDFERQLKSKKFIKGGSNSPVKNQQNFNISQSPSKMSNNINQPQAMQRGQRDSPYVNTDKTQKQYQLQNNLSPNMQRAINTYETFNQAAANIGNYMTPQLNPKKAQNIYETHQSNIKSGAVKGFQIENSNSQNNHNLSQKLNVKTFTSRPKTENGFENVSTRMKSFNVRSPINKPIVTISDAFNHQSITQYCCKRCQAQLFTNRDIQEHVNLNSQSNNILSHMRTNNFNASGGNTNQTTCEFYYIQKKDWMSNSGNNIKDNSQKSTINCPNKSCNQIIGQQNWNGLKCSCGRLVSPAFQMLKSQICQKSNGKQLNNQNMQQNQAQSSQMAYEMKSPKSPQIQNKLIPPPFPDIFQQQNSQQYHTATFDIQKRKSSAQPIIQSSNTKDLYNVSKQKPNIIYSQNFSNVTNINSKRDQQSSQNKLKIQQLQQNLGQNGKNNTNIVIVNHSSNNNHLLQQNNYNTQKQSTNGRKAVAIGNYI